MLLARGEYVLKTDCVTLTSNSHVYHDAAPRPERLRLHKSLAALVASDHLPLVADFTLA